MLTLQSSKQIFTNLFKIHPCIDISKELFPKYVLLALILGFSLVSEAQPFAQKRNGYLSYQLDAYTEKSSISASKSDVNAKWFDDRPSKTGRHVYELGLSMPWDMEFGYRYRHIHGVHTGAASAYRCVLFFCSWVSSSVITGLNTNDTIEYDIKNNQIWVSKPIIEFGTLKISGLLGVNIIAANVTVSGAGQKEYRKVTAPLPVIGGTFHYPLGTNFDVTGMLQYFQYSNNTVAGYFRDSSIDLNMKVSKDFVASLGYGEYLLRINYSKSPTSASVEVPQRAPHFKITYTF